MRVTWLLLPLAAGPVFAAALDGTSRPVQLVDSAGLWGVWAAVLVATLIPRTVSLTAVRIVAPAACVGAAAAVVVVATGSGDADVAVGWQVAGLVSTLLAAGAAFSPTTGHSFVNGSSYGDEVRFPLRAPGPLLLGPVELVWLGVVAGAVSGPLLLAARQWVAGVLLLAVGWTLAVWGARVLHGLSRRWVVFVPAGLVLHDPLALSDPVLIRRTHVAALGAAPAGSEALDLSRGALGLALEMRMKEPAALGVAATRRGDPVQTTEVERVLFTPSRPGALLDAAHTRRIA